MEPDGFKWHCVKSDFDFIVPRSCVYKGHTGGAQVIFQIE